MKPIGTIVWPENPQAAGKLFLEYAILVVDRANIAFPAGRPNPLALAKAYVAGDVSDAEIRSEKDAWWRYVEANGGVTNFVKPDILAARLAICLLPTPDRAAELGDTLSWFLEVLDFMNINTRLAIELIDTHFQSTT